MGKSSSKPKEPLLDIEQNVRRREAVLPYMREYIPPAEREKIRTDPRTRRPPYNELNVELIDHSADRFDYVLFLRHPKSLLPKAAKSQDEETKEGVEETKGEEPKSCCQKICGCCSVPDVLNFLEETEESKKKKMIKEQLKLKYGDYFVSWGFVSMMWRQATPGLADDKDLAVKLLAGYWKGRYDECWGTKKQDEDEEEDKDNAEDKGDDEIYMRPGEKLTKQQRQKQREEELERALKNEKDIEDEDELPLGVWLDLLWEIITNTLSVGFGVGVHKSCAGLHVKTSETPDGEYKVCRIRAPWDLLEQIATESEYRLPFRDEVDPGVPFWNRDDGAEVEYEKSPLDPGVTKPKEKKKRALRRLQKLYDICNIPPTQVGISEDQEPSERHWTRRIRVIERVVDQVKCHNRFNAYGPFDASQSKRILFKVQPTIRGHTLFQSKDRLNLVNSRIEKFFFMSVLQEKHNKEFDDDFQVIDYFPLHDGSRGDIVTREALRKIWVFFWRSKSTIVGAPLVSQYYMTRGENIPFTWRFFSQPLDEVRGYFGEKLALYFAWMGSLCWNLRPWCLFGAVIQFYLSSYGTGCAETTPQYWTFAVLVMVLLETSYVHINWQQEEKVIAVKWGTEGFEEQEEDRAEFEPEGLRIDRITNQKEVFYPETKRNWDIMMHYIFICCFIVVLLIAVDFVYWLSYFLEYDVGLSWGSYVGSIVSVVQIEVLSSIYTKVVEAMNDKENHQTETQFEDNLITKTLLFQMVNKYAALTYTAFIKKHTYGCSSTCCISDLSSLLTFVFIGNMVSNCFELKLHVKIIECITSSKLFRNCCNKDGQAVEEEDEADEEKDEDQFLNEMKLEEDEGTFNDYAEIVLLYGYITLFAMALPVASLVAMFMILLEIRVDAYKYTALARRPNPTPAEDVGMWGNLTLAMGFLAIPFNVGIMVFATENYSDYSSMAMLLIFLTTNHVLLLVKYFIHMGYPDEPDFLDDIKKRNEFVVQKYLRFADYDDEEGGAVKGKGHAVDINDLDFDGEAQKAEADLRKPENKWKRKETEKRIVQKRNELRQSMLRLKKVEDHLGNLANKEIFPSSSDEDAVPRDAQGFPLGFLQISVRKFKMELPYDQKVDVPIYSDIMFVARLKYDNERRRNPQPQEHKHVFPSSEENIFDCGKTFFFAPVESKRAVLHLELHKLKIIGYAKRKDGTEDEEKPIESSDVLGTIKFFLSEKYKRRSQAGPVLTQKKVEFGYLDFIPSAEAPSPMPTYSIEVGGAFNFSKKQPLEEEKRKLLQNIKAIETELAMLYTGQAEMKREEQASEDEENEENEGKK